MTTLKSLSILTSICLLVSLSRNSMETQQNYLQVQFKQPSSMIGQTKPGSKKIIIKKNKGVEQWTATAYWAGSCGKKTSSRGYGRCSSGFRVAYPGHTKVLTWKQARTVAAPANIPIGTKLRITFPKHLKHMNGIYTVRDRGGRIKGHLLDIYIESKQQCLDFGRQKIKVEVFK